MFIGRKAELDYLNQLYQKPGGQFMILYGRRRVGKTETLVQFCKYKRHIFFSCTESSDEEQLAALSQRILHEENPAAKYIDRFANWNDLFANLADITGDSDDRLVVVIDEFPYMVRGNASIPSILQNLWDHRLKSCNIFLILCGSAMSFIEKEILAEKNPLYGRATAIYKMQEMNYLEAGEFMTDYSASDKLTMYAVLGGIPYYLAQMDPRVSLRENIIQNILKPGSILYNEVEFLLRQELRETATYNSIIRAIALGNTRLNDIYQKTAIEKSKLSAYLNNLIELGIVYREFPMDAGIKEQANVNRGFYRLADSFFAFWYAYVFPYRSELELGDANGIWKHVIEPELNHFVSYPFEKICWQYLRNRNRVDQLPFHFIKIGHWRNKENEEVDILATDAQGNRFLAGECKFRNQEMNKSDLQYLQDKLHAVQGQKYWYLFSKSGFADNLKELQRNGEVELISVEEMY